LHLLECVGTVHPLIRQGDDVDSLLEDFLQEVSTLIGALAGDPVDFLYQEKTPGANPSVLYHPLASFESFLPPWITCRFTEVGKPSLGVENHGGVLPPAPRLRGFTHDSIRALTAEGIPVLLLGGREADITVCDSRLGHGVTPRGLIRSR